MAGLWIRLKAWLATAGLILAAGSVLGGSAVLTWEHLSPLGLGAALDKSAARVVAVTAERDKARREDKAKAEEITRWRAAYDRLNGTRLTEQAAAAAAVASRTAATSKQCNAAFDSGYRAGLIMGANLATKETANPVAGGGGAGVSGDTGVSDDFRSLYTGGTDRPRAGA